MWFKVAFSKYLQLLTYNILTTYKLHINKLLIIIKFVVETHI